ncbi:hypothetical protein KI387_042499 [Taxus chinensis]|uniref:TLC domain-containing protein n=1 Tax=Taxus chinensis TaxID=29808 RepID=A0AA38F7A4_TAXCH|nr:hypothetical protein KI387_042499 [Taxus chinensis]
MEYEERAKTVVVGVAAWTATFFGVRKTLWKRSFDFCNRVVSLIHVAVALWLCSVSIQDWRHPLHPLASPATPSQIHALAVSLSYFIYDSICCLFDSSISLPNCIHHLVSVLGLGGGVMYAKSGSELIGCLWLMEISNPFMHMRELLKELGYKDSSLSIINDVCFALVFTFARLIIGPYIVYVTVTADNPLIIKGPMERLLLPSGPVQLLNCKNENRQKIALHRNVGAATAWEDDFPRWVVMWG